MNSTGPGVLSVILMQVDHTVTTLLTILSCLGWQNHKNNAETLTAQDLRHRLNNFNVVHIVIKYSIQYNTIKMSLCLSDLYMVRQQLMAIDFFLSGRFILK